MPTYRSNRSAATSIAGPTSSLLCHIPIYWAIGSPLRQNQCLFSIPNIADGRVFALLGEHLQMPQNGETIVDFSIDLFVNQTANVALRNEFACSGKASTQQNGPTTGTTTDRGKKKKKYKQKEKKACQSIDAGPGKMCEAS